MLSSVERSRVEEGTSDAPASAAPAAPLAAAVPAMLTPATALALQRTIGNANVVRLARAPQGQVLIKTSVTQITYDALLDQTARRLGLPKTDPKVLRENDAATRKQVGDINYFMWLNEREELAEAKAAAEAKAKEDAEAAEKARLAAIEEFGPGSEFRRAAELNKRATAINAAVVEVEYLAHKLRSPEGVKGYAYQGGVAAHGLMWGVGVESIKYAKDKANPIQYAAEKVVGVTPGPTIEEKGGQLAETAETSIAVLTGKLNDYYQRTRPYYAAYQKAQKAFSAAQDAFTRHTGDSISRLAHLGAMQTAVDDMASSMSKYRVVVTSLGIPEKAMKLDRLGKAITTGWTSGVELAADQLGGLAMPDASDGTSKAAPELLKKKLFDARTAKEKAADFARDKAIEAAVEHDKAQVKKMTQ